MLSEKLVQILTVSFTDKWQPSSTQQPHTGSSPWMKHYTIVVERVFFMNKLSLFRFYQLTTFLSSSCFWIF